MKTTYFTVGLLVLFVSSGVLAAPTINSPPRKSCPAQLEKDADEAFAKMVLYGDFGVLWPTNEAELQTLCSQYKTRDKVVRTYARTCLEGLTQQIIALILRGSGKMFKQFCGEKGDKSVFKYSSCGNSNPQFDHECMHKYVQMSKDSLTLPEAKRMAGACCSYNEFEACIVNRLRKEPKCNNDAIVFFKNQIKSLAGEALDLTCSEYKANPDQCQGVLKKMKKKKMPGKSLLLPIAEVMQSLS